MQDEIQHPLFLVRGGAVQAEARGNVGAFEPGAEYLFGGRGSVVVPSPCVE